MALKIIFWRNQLKDIPSYKITTDLVNNLACVNDVAKHRLALILNFNSSISKYEEQKQYLLHVVEQHRKKFSSYNRNRLADI